MPHESPKERRDEERMRKRKEARRGNLHQGENAESNKPYRTNPPGPY